MRHMERTPSSMTNLTIPVITPSHGFPRPPMHSSDSVSRYIDKILAQIIGDVCPGIENGYPSYLSTEDSAVTSPSQSHRISQVILNGCGFFGTSVATLICGQLKPPKFSSTVCEYWIWIPGILILRGALGSFPSGGRIANSGVGAVESLGITGRRGVGILASVSAGTSTSYITVSIQKRDFMRGARALGLAG